MATATHAPTAPTPATRRPRPGLASRLVQFFSKGFVQAILAVTAILWIVPTIGLLVTSLRTPRDAATSGWWTALLKPAQLTLNGYGNLLQDQAFLTSLWNTIAITVPSTVLVVLIAALAGYAFATIQFPGRDVLFLVVVGLLVVPIQIGLIPVAQLFQSMGIFGYVPGAVLFHIAFGLPFAIFLLRNFFAGIPAELLEAARLDGASELRIFFKVVLPLGLPAIASLAIFQFLWVWNDLLVALIFAGNAKPLTVLIQEQTGEFSNNIDVIAPGAFLTMVIPLIVFFAFQRYFVQGILAGSTK